MIKGKIDTSAVSGFVKDINDKFTKAIQSAKDEIIPMVIEYAKSHHKFKSQSGTLYRAIQAREVDGGLEFYLDTKIAEYANYIVTGQRRTNTGKTVKVAHGADDFLNKAVTDNEDKILSILNKYINEVTNG